MRIDITAEIATTTLTRPDGSKVDGWVLTAHESGPDQPPDQVVFSGPHGSERATQYARERYERVNYRMHADPGKIQTPFSPTRAVA